VKKPKTLLETDGARTMLHALIDKNNTKDNISKRQSEPDALGRDRSSGWAGYSSLSLGGEKQSPQGKDRGQGWQPMNLSPLSQGGILVQRQALPKKDKTVLEKEGITSARIIDNDETDVQKIIQNTLSDSKSKLFPYVKDKLKNLQDGKIKYNILDPAVFAYKYREYAKKRNSSIDSSTKDEDLVKEIGGFYDPKEQAIYLKTRSNYCDAFHETIHSFSTPIMLSMWLGGDIMEGLTQFFTDVVLREQLGNVCNTHNYENQLKCATKLVDTFGFDPLARLFFLNDIKILEIIAKKLGLKNIVYLRNLKSDGICKKIM
jgi:hypothetical protein